MQAFVSYNVQDQAFVARLANALNGNGITPFTNNLQLAFGDRIYDELDRAFRDCNFAIAVLTRAYMESDWLQKEFVALYLKEKLAKKDYLLPVLAENCEVPRFLDREKICDLRDVPPDRLYDRLSTALPKTRQVFVVMKIGNAELDAAYEKAIKPAIEGFGYTALRVDQIETADPITPRILSEIRTSSIVLADLTFRRPNCYYETGYAHALDKTTILTVRDGDTIDFDLSFYKFIIWKTPADLREALQNRFAAIAEASKQ